MNIEALRAATPRIPQCSCELLPLHRNLQRRHSSRIRMKTTVRRFPVKAATSEESGHRSIVDEDMLVLRKRMHELRMEEINYVPPQEWMEWEKNWYPSYGSDVCYSLLWLQQLLLNTRPSVVMAILALISLSVPTSLLLLLIQTPTHLKGVTMELLSYLER